MTDEIALHRVLNNLANPYNWNWRNGISRRDAADEVLSLLAKEGIIEERRHPFGGRVWRYNGALYGRVDGITPEEFTRLKT